jgi:nucleotide-binding universal stress UspA family protein
MPTSEGTGPPHEEPGERAPITSEPLSELEAERAREEALRRAGERWTNPVTSSTRGRVEEETRQLTERLAREERERRRAAARAASQTTSQGAPYEAFQRIEGQRLPVTAPIRRILVTLDGSLYAERALPYAEALGRMTGAEIVVAHSTDRADLARLAGADHTRAAGDPIASNLERARARIAAGGLDARTRIVYSPDPAEGLVTLQSELDASVIALASHARQGIDRALLGSVADEVTQLSRGYVLVTPPGAADMRDKRVTFSRILLPLDGSELAESALAIAATLLTQPSVSERPRRMTLLFIAESHAQEADGASYLREIQEALEQETDIHNVVFTKVVVGSPPSAIVAEASGAHAPIPSVARYDLLLMATHGRGGLSRWFYGSVATYALTHGDTPILLVRSQRVS